MKLLVLACLIAVASAEFKLSLFPEAPIGNGNRIINGAPATAGQAPYICSLRLIPITAANHMCGASILREGWALSAAHCITDIPNVGTVDLQCGVTHRTNDVATQQIRPFHRTTDTFIHSGWVAGTVGPDDIVVIRINTPFTFNNVVQPIRQMEDYVDGGVVRLFGWGATQSQGGALPLPLQTVEKDVLTFAECDARLRAINPTFGDPLRDTNICAARAFSAACGGDSGGPLVVFEAGEAVQVGVVSWGISPCGIINGVPSVYARNSAYISWMNGIMG